MAIEWRWGQSRAAGLDNFMVGLGCHAILPAPAGKVSTRQFPDFIKAFPGINLPFPLGVVETNALRSDVGLVAFFTFLKDMQLSVHSYGAQWGSVIAGQIVRTIDEETKTYGLGDSFFIPAGVEHGPMIKAGTRAIDVFEEPDRHTLKG